MKLRLKIYKNMAKNLIVAHSKYAHSHAHLITKKLQTNCPISKSSLSSLQSYFRCTLLSSYILTLNA